jgi:hypothetical protein
MSKQNIALLTLPFTATTSLVVGRFATIAGALPADGANAVGVAQTSGAIGAVVPVDILGTAIAEAGAAFDAGDALEVTGTGKVIKKNTGIVVARALQASTGDGKLVEIVLIPN